MKRAVHCAERPADAPAEQRQLLFTGAAQRLANRPVQLVADELGESHVRVGLVGDPPVEEEDVEAFGEQELDERVALAQIEYLRTIDQRKHEQHRDRVLAPF